MRQKEIFNMEFYDDEEVGYDEILDDEELGAARRGRRRGRKSKYSRRSVFPVSKKRKAVRREIEKAVLTGDTAPDVGFRPLGLSAGRFTAAVTTEVQLDAVVQDPFIPVRPVIVVVYSSAWDGGIVLLDDIKVGSKSQLLGTEGGPASAFSPDAQNIQLKGDLAGAGITVTAEFNLSTAATAGVADVGVWVMGISQG